MRENHTSTLLGWSVTVAGNYHPQLAPDVEMRLSFPKTQTETTTLMQAPSTTTTNRDFYEMTPPPGASECRPRPALPPTNSHTLNPKRTLTKVTPAPSGITQKSSLSTITGSQFEYLVTSAANGRNYRFPEVNTATSQAVSRQTAKKAIKVELFGRIFAMTHILTPLLFSLLFPDQSASGVQRCRNFRHPHNLQIQPCSASNVLPVSPSNH